jgi:hypothetical protein
VIKSSTEGDAAQIDRAIFVFQPTDTSAFGLHASRSLKFLFDNFLESHVWVFQAEGIELADNFKLGFAQLNVPVFFGRLRFHSESVAPAGRDEETPTCFADALME